MATPLCASVVLDPFSILWPDSLYHLTVVLLGSPSPFSVETFALSGMDESFEYVDPLSGEVMLSVSIPLTVTIVVFVAELSEPAFVAFMDMVYVPGVIVSTGLYTT